MLRALTPLAIALFACATTAHAGPVDDLGKVEKFITTYHRDPTPAQVPEMLRTVLKGEVVQAFTAKEPPQQLLLLAHAFGHMARGKAELVRTYESEFATSS